MLAVNKAFFALPAEEKLKIVAKNNKNFRGYTPMKASPAQSLLHKGKSSHRMPKKDSKSAAQEETLDPKGAKSPDTKEGLYFGRDVPEDSPEARTTPLTGPNQWPSEVCMCT